MKSELLQDQADPRDDGRPRSARAAAAGRFAGAGGENCGVAGLQHRRRRQALALGVRTGCLAAVPESPSSVAAREAGLGDRAASATPAVRH